MIQPPTMTDVRRRRAIAWAASVLADPRIVFLDTETTGLGADAEIVDIAIVAADGTVLLDTLVHPIRPIPAGATVVHGIGDDDVAFAPDWSESWGTVGELVAGRVVVAYNVDYDRSMIEQCNRALELPAFAPADWQCAMRAFSDFDGTPGRRDLGLKWWKLSEAAERFAIEPGTHRALADAETCRRVVLALANGGHA
jgi:DNA polymerase-3 subunit epsilon